MKHVMLVGVLGAMLSSAGACGSEEDLALEGASEDVESELELAYEEAGLKKPLTLSLPRAQLVTNLLELSEGALEDEATTGEVTSAYSSLSAQELDAFNLLRMQRHVGKLEATARRPPRGGSHR